MHARTVLGWREWIGLPELESGATLAKMDTGAWSNTLHAEEISLTDNGMERIVKFRLSKNGNWFERPLHEWRRVRDTGGHDTLRPVIRTTLEVAGEDHDIQICLNHLCLSYLIISQSKSSLVRGIVLCFG